MIHLNNKEERPLFDDVIFEKYRRLMHTGYMTNLYNLVGIKVNGEWWEFRETIIAGHRNILSYEHTDTEIRELLEEMSEIIDSGKARVEYEDDRPFLMVRKIGKPEDKFANKWGEIEYPV